MPFSEVSLCLFFLLVGTQHVNPSEDEIVVILKPNLLPESIELICYVNKLQNGIEFIDPSGIIRAFCLATVRSIPPTCTPENITTQDFEQKRTKLMLSPITAQDIGRWECKHGTNTGSDFVDVYPLIVSSAQKDDDNGMTTEHQIDHTEVVTHHTDISEESDGTLSATGDSVVIGIITAVIVVGAVLGLCWYYRKRGRTSHRRREGTKNENRPLLETGNSVEDKTIQNCNNCNKYTRFCYCYECGKSFCKVCLEKVHVTHFQNHHIIQFHHYPESDQDVQLALKCQVCRKHNVSYVCFKCTEKYAKCLECHCDHEINPSDKLRVLVAYKTKIERREPKVLMKTSIDLTNTVPRIRSLALLNVNTVVVTDFWQRKLICSNGKHIYRELTLTSEPRGLVRLSNQNKFAVTFGYEHTIKFFAINEKRFSLSEYRRLTVEGHPFQIAHHKGLFAVEMNEGSDGRIVIMDETGKVENTVQNDDYMISYYTGNSMRLALNRDKEDLYVSAIGKQTFYCLNFEGFIKWQIQIPSPRSIVEIPGGNFDTRILLASRRSNKIFYIRCRKKHDADGYYPPSVKALHLDNLVSPDFMDYRKLKGDDGNKEHGYITVEVEKFKVHVYEMPDL